MFKRPTYTRHNEPKIRHIQAKMLKIMCAELESVEFDGLTKYEPQMQATEFSQNHNN